VLQNIQRRIQGTTTIRIGNYTRVSRLVCNRRWIITIRDTGRLAYFQGYFGKKKYQAYYYEQVRFDGYYLPTST
jgi:hypothetical protein